MAPSLRSRRCLARVCRATLTVALCSLGYATRARAQEPFGVSSSIPSPPPSQGIEQAVVGRYWELGRPRPFFAAMVEAGYAYVRPRFLLGYGLPYWRYIALEAYPLASLNSVGHYAGLSAGIPGLTARLGGRYTYPFSRSLLPVQESYTRTDLELLDGPKADYLALEAEIAATVPLFIGSVFAVATAYRTELVEEGYYLFEDNLRAIMEPPYIWRGRLGYLAAFGKRGAIRLGVAGDLIGLPGRDEYVVRGGALASVIMTASLEAQASFIPVLLSPDSIGLQGGDFGQLGVRFRWATESTPDPEKLRKARAQDENLRREEADRIFPSPP